MIQGAGAIYEVIATWLNDLENYRTDTEYSDGQIQKNFAFQFINNYFVLFYIAYLRQINLPSWGVSGKTCPESCLSEIQLQMIVVFSLLIRPLITSGSNRLIKIIRHPACRQPSVTMPHPLVWNMGMMLIQVESASTPQRLA